MDRERLARWLDDAGGPRQRLRKLSRVTTSPAGRSDAAGDSVSAAGAGRLPTGCGSAGGPANSSAKLTDGSAKLRIAAHGIVRRSSCFWKLRLTENTSSPISRSQ